MIGRRLFLHGLAGAAFAAPATRCELPWGNKLPPSQVVPPNGGPLFQPPPVKPRPRPLLSELAPDDPIFTKLRRAYDTLRQRSVTNCGDRTGLLYWAWMHDYNCDVSPANVHASWDFLPWHRAFIYFHERAIQQIVGQHFRLPVWDWDNHDAAPPFYRDWIKTLGCVHAADDLGGKPISRCSLQAWLLSQSPGDFQGGAHQPGHAVAGPHSYGHTHIGRPMIPPATAAVDPLFYAHHANVDRFWQFWRNSYDFHDDWPDREFSLYDENGNPVRIAVKDLLDPEKLGYRFDPAKMPARSLLYPYTALREYTKDATNHGIALTEAGLHALENLLDLAFETRLGLDELRQAVALAHSYAKQAWDLASGFVRSLPDAVRQIELPVRIVALPPDARAGQYYFVGMRELSDHSQEPTHPIGGFGIFADPGSHAHQTVIVTGCMGAEDVSLLLAWNGRVRFVYAPPAPNGVVLDTLQEEDLWPIDTFELLTPKT